MRVILQPESTPNSIGDDTFWLWFKREFPESVWSCDDETKDDIVLQYATRGPHVGPAKSVALLWELYPEMAAKLPDFSTPKIAAMMECSRSSDRRTIPTAATSGYYSLPADILPIGVDTEVFKPLDRKKELRLKHGIPEDVEVGFWSGTSHPMKGHDRLLSLAQTEKDIRWIIAWKNDPVDQLTLNEMMNCCDFFLSTSRLTPLFLVEWEAMASGLPLVNAPGVIRELPEGSSREAVLDLGWDRHSAKTTWAAYLGAIA